MLIFGLLSAPNCGEVTFFFAFNTATIDEARTTGAILVIGTPQEVDTVRLLSGTIPPGMQLEDDTTVRGIPTESGNFFFEIEATHRDGQTEILPFEVEIE